MKSLINFITEGVFINRAKKAKNLEEFLCIYLDLKHLTDLTKNDYEEFDLGYVVFNSDLSLRDFIKKVKSYGNAKLEKMKFDGSDEGEVEFICKGDNFWFTYAE